METQHLMIEAIKKIQNKATETGLQVDTNRLYHIAAQLTVAQCSNGNFYLSSGMSADEQVQRIFANHFVFLVNHSIDLIGLEKSQ